MNKYLLKCSSLIIYSQVKGAPPSPSWTWPWPRRNIFVLRFVVVALRMLTRTGFLRRAPNCLPACRASRVQDQTNEKRRSLRRLAFRRGPTTPPPRPPQVLCGEFSLCLLRGTLLQGTGGRGEGSLSLYPKGDHSQKQQGLLHFSPMFFSAVGWCHHVRKSKRSLLQWRRQSGFVND